MLPPPPHVSRVLCSHGLLAAVGFLEALKPRQVRGIVLCRLAQRTTRSSLTVSLLLLLLLLMYYVAGRVGAAPGDPVLPGGRLGRLPRRLRPQTRRQKRRDRPLRVWGFARWLERAFAHLRAKVGIHLYLCGL